MHYVAKDIYQPVIIASYWNYTTGDMTAYVTSDLWEDATGMATFTWLDYRGKKLSTPSLVPFTVGALNTTQVFQVNTSTLAFPLSNALLQMSVTASGTLPNSKVCKTFKHESFFHDWNLNTVDLVDPGLVLDFNNKTEKFILEATSGVAAWVWMDYPAGVRGNFEENAFWLVPGCKREIGFTMIDNGGNVEWWRDVTVRSLWNNTQK